MSERILAIEDDPGTRELLAVHIKELGFEPDFAADGISGLDRALSNDYALVILDVSLPGKSGLDVCKAIRREKEFLPLLMLTARDSEIDRVLGLELGADDYLTKPFSIRELGARIRALLRRAIPFSAAPAEERPALRFGNLSIDFEKHEILRDNEIVELSPIEFQLLELLVSKPGRVFSRAEILEGVWGISTDNYEENISAHINRLRKKLEKNLAEPELIQTVRGIGYRFSPPGEQATPSTP